MAARLSRRLTALIPNIRLRVWARHIIHLHLEDCEPELTFLTRLIPGTRRTAVDVGANVGHYSVALSRHFENVVAFEINPHLTSDLARTSENISVENIGLSSSRRRATLYIPMHEGRMPLYGWASLSPGNCPDTSIHQELAVSLDTLDSRDLLGVDFIKIDVEGHEFDMLQGARKTLEQNSPTLLIEIKERNVPAVTELLSSLGYVEIDMSPLIGHSSPENHLFRKRT